MDAGIIEKSFANVKVIKSFANSGQKYVFLIEHPEYHQVILKVVKDMNDRILREIDIPTKYQIPNIPQIYKVDNIVIENKDYTYIIEQYISGKNLTLESKINKFSVERSLRLLESLLITAVELEKARIVHRDIKPDNIICCDSGGYYLIDFGIARNLNLESLTYTKAAVGPHTPGYGAPELFQYNKSVIGIKADLFSIGVVVYETIFGRHPFITGNEIDINEIWYKTATVVPKDFSIVGDDDRKLISFLQTLMQKHISRRPPTAQKALDWFYIVEESIKS
jgi:serine/threonine protein kinase